MQNLYFITDYAGNIVGNPKGYKTQRGANCALSRGLKYKLWGSFDNRPEEYKESNLIWSIILK